MALSLKLNQQHNDIHGKKASMGRILINVSVVGSSGPIKFLANEVETAAEVIRKTIRAYRRQRRLPMLGNDPENFFLYSADVDAVLNSSVAVGSYGCRNFLMCEKPAAKTKTKTQTKGSSMKKWLKRSLNFMVSSSY